jgi:hypothetical protein
MPHAARRSQWTEAACYHVLNRGHARETLFHDDADRATFLKHKIQQGSSENRSASGPDTSVKGL